MQSVLTASVTEFFQLQPALNISVLFIAVVKLVAHGTLHFDKFCFVFSHMLINYELQNTNYEILGIQNLKFTIQVLLSPARHWRAILSCQHRTGRFQPLSLYFLNSV